MDAEAFMAHLLGGRGQFRLAVAGTIQAQKVLADLAGPKCHHGHDLDCLAALIFHDDNMHDNKAVAVMLVHRGGSLTMIGYLPRAEAREYRASVASWGTPDPTGMLCRAKIVGGWSDTGSGSGNYGVKLDLALPISFRTSLAWKNWEQRLL